MESHLANMMTHTTVVYARGCYTVLYGRRGRRSTHETSNGGAATTAAAAVAVAAGAGQISCALSLSSRRLQSTTLANDAHTRGRGRAHILKRTTHGGCTEKRYLPLTRNALESNRPDRSGRRWTKRARVMYAGARTVVCLCVCVWAS